MEDSLQTFQQKIQDTYYDLDKNHLRKMQKKMYDCAANCCSNNTDSFNQVQSCIDKCTAPYQNAQQYVKNQFEDFQKMVERCILVCNDDTKSMMERNKFTEVNDKVKAHYEKCATSCITKYLELLPTTVYKMKDTLKSHDL